MWKIRTIKSNGKEAMKKNYSTCLIVCIIMVFLVSGPLSITKTMDNYLNYIDRFGQETGIEKISSFTSNIKNFEKKFRDATSVGDESSAGFISGLYHSSQKTGTVAGGVLLIFDKLFFKGDVSRALISGLGVVIALLFLIFVKNLFRVGAARFFMDNNLQNNVHISDIVMVYKMKRTSHCAKIMFLRNILIILWCFTLIGGVIKFYSYRMVPYVLAENPSTSRKDAFNISIQMMKGNKFKAFLLDVSFLHWWILSVITFGIVQYLYLEPYMRSAYAELYITLRDEDLDIVPFPEEKKERTYDYHRSYTIYNLILIFFAFAIFGWIWECTLNIIQNGYFVNRGSLYGPWVPIYGFGGIGIIVLLKRFADHPIVTFLLAMLLCGILEGGTGWYLDTIKGMRYWDYTNFYFNIHGYVCLEGLLVFGLGGCMFIYLLAPMLDSFFNRFPKKNRIAICTMLLAVFLSDFVYSQFEPHTGKGIGGYNEDNEV